MNLMLSVGRLGKVAAAIAVASLSLSACSEVLDSTAGCPEVCGGQTTDVENILLDAVTYDTTVPSSFSLGTEPQIFLAAMGDSVDTRGILRFDTLQYYRRTSSTDTTPIAITYVDDAKLHVQFDSVGATFSQPVTISVYDVGTNGNDTAVSVLAPLFAPGRLLGQRVFPAGTLVDTVTIPVDDAVVLNNLLARTKLRLGIQVSAAFPVALKMSAKGVYTSFITFQPSPDTAVLRVGVGVNSLTPTDNASAANFQSDFTLIVEGSPPPPVSDVVSIGGLPAKRGFYRFNIPSNLIDSSIIVRATLELVQVGSGITTPLDSINLAPTLVVAGPSITDPVRASQILGGGAFDLGLSYTSFNAIDVTREIFVTTALTRFWSLQDSSKLPRAIVLRMVNEGFTHRQLYFYSNSHPDPTKRPKLRVSYTPRTRIGLP